MTSSTPATPLEARSLQVDPQGLTFQDGAGGTARVPRGTIRRLVLRRVWGELELVIDGPSGTVVVRRGQFDYRSLFGPAAGDIARDFEKLVGGIRQYSPVDVDDQSSADASSSGRGSPVVRGAPRSAPAPVSPSSAVSFDLLPDPVDAPASSGAMEIAPAHEMMAEAPRLQQQEKPREVAEVGYHPSMLGRTHGPTCTNCGKGLDDAAEHYLIAERPWCTDCGKEQVVPAAASLGFLVLRLVPVVLAARATWLLLPSLGMPIFIAAMGAALVGAAFGYLLLLRLKVVSPDGVLQRFRGVPGGRGEELPVADAAMSVKWLTARLLESKLTLVVGIGAAVGLSVWAFGAASASFPAKLTWHGREVERLITQTDLNTRVSFSQYMPPRQGPSNASAFVILARGEIDKAELLKRLVGTAANIDAGSPEAKGDVLRTCRLASVEGASAVVYAVVRPCAHGMCGAVGRRVLSEGLRMECGLEEHYAGLDAVIAMPWSQ